MTDKRSDTMTRKASFDEVTWALSDLFKTFKDAAKAQGMEFLEFFMNQEIQTKLREEQEVLCVLMGWTYDQHRQHEHNEIMAEMEAEQ
jgi:hypothetical protein